MSWLFAIMAAASGAIAVGAYDDKTSERSTTVFIWAMLATVILRLCSY